MPIYIFKLDDPSVLGVMEEFPDDASAKRHACIVADEIHRCSGRRPNRVLVFEDGNLLAAVSPLDDGV